MELLHHLRTISAGDVALQRPAPGDRQQATTLKGLIANGIVERRSYDEIPPRVEYSLTEKGRSVVPILHSICQWAGVFYKDAGDAPMIQCQRCDHRG